MCGEKRIHSFNRYVEVVVSNNVSGDFVECGTWKGGVAALMLHHIVDSKQSRKLYIYDTFMGMPSPGENDHPDAFKFYEDKKDGEFSDWCRAGVDVVEETLAAVTPDYSKHCVIVPGLVENTLDVTTPSSIAICRLDTDWYSSTKKEIETLYPKVSRGGFIVVDDYSDWPGCKQAIDEFLSNLDQDEYYLTIEHGPLVIHKR